MEDVFSFSFPANALRHIGETTPDADETMARLCRWGNLNSLEIVEIHVGDCDGPECLLLHPSSRLQFRDSALGKAPALVDAVEERTGCPPYMDITARSLPHAFAGGWCSAMYIRGDQLDVLKTAAEEMGYMVVDLGNPVTIALTKPIGEPCNINITNESL